MGPFRRFILLFLAFLLTFDALLVVYTTTTKATILDPVFLERELADRSVYPRIKQQIINELTPKVPDWLTYALRDSVTEDWVEEQAHGIIHDLYDYFWSENASLDLRISLVEVKNNIKANIRESPPPEIRDQPSEVVDEFLLDLDTIIDSKFPDEIELVDFLDEEILTSMRRVKTFFLFVNRAYYLLFIMAAMLMFLIAVTTRDIRLTLLIFGLSMLVSGGVSYGMSFFLLGQFPVTEIPAPISGEMLGLVRDVLHVMRDYSIYLSVAGLILIGMYVIAPARRKEPPPRPGRVKSLSEKP